MRHYLTSHEINWSFSLPDERLAGLPLVSAHREPQIAPQEYECGCVTVTRITDRDHRRGERPFEMRLAVACQGEACELAQLEGVDLEIVACQGEACELAQLEGVDLEIVGRSSGTDERSAPESRSADEEMWRSTASAGREGDRS